MKRYKMLEKAMNDYPKGTLVKWPSGNETVNGVYKFTECGQNRIVDSDGNTINNGFRWAEIVAENPKSILDGKAAIEVKNEREFKLLMYHYEGKEWKWNGGSSPSHTIHIPRKFPDFVTYEDSFTHADTIVHNEKYGYKVISFEEFANETGVEVPVFAIKSVDGVDLFFGDTVHRSYWDSFENQWKYDMVTLNNDRNAVITGVDKAKAFSTKEAADKWIDENNKSSKELIFNSFLKATIDSSGVLIENSATGMKQLIFKSEMNKIIESYESF